MLVLLFIYLHRQPMVEIIPAQSQDLKQIQSIASRTWPDTFSKILSSDQIDYMLYRFYNLPQLEEQVEQGHIFLFAEENGEKLGFTGIQVNQKPGQTKIHKIYILPTAQGKGIGKKLINAIKAPEPCHCRLFLRFIKGQYWCSPLMAWVQNPKNKNF